ncbi:hypothetical protein [Hyphomonas sp. UBA4494]|jgi:hypothetical protein|uniref:hypothetical protein n=1 Tax=Hyphomonas sp. UBA4494 TaxID=1946631 RepID=UPI0025BC815E|nr:hypothetical protein [Hyphomonas sp. UBA4494]
MPQRDYDSTPVSDELGLQDVIKGLAADIQGLRDGKVSIQDAHARAALAKQLFNGCRIYLQAVKTIEAAAKRIEQVPE